jgi:hypothetical protein
VSGGRIFGSTFTNNVAFDDGGAADRSEMFDCIIAHNRSEDDGGGVDDCILRNCIVRDNSTSGRGGGAFETVLYNCTVTGNSARRGGGVCGRGVDHPLFNCIVYHNRAPAGSNYFNVRFDYSCTSPLPWEGVGNISADPQLASVSHLAASSPCLGAGSFAFAAGSDIDGESWRNPPSMGADEGVPGGALGSLTVEWEADYTNIAAGFSATFKNRVEGQVTATRWSFADGPIISNRLAIARSWDVPGTYPVVLTAFNDGQPGGISATAVVTVFEAPIAYVNAAGSNPVFPFASWATAATSIQQAIAAGSVAGRVVLVTNGIYDTGGVAVWGLATNRVALTSGVVVRSVNGPSATIIRGEAWDAAGNGIRCAYVGRGSILDGFTLTNGHTRTTGHSSREQGGGGAWAERTGILTNCILIGNRAWRDGGGVNGGILHGCILSGNEANDDGGGADDSTLFHCVLTGNATAPVGGGGGGGADESILFNCVVGGNSSPSNAGGGTDDSTLTACLVTNNVAFSGGGTSGGFIYNSVLARNKAQFGAGDSGSTLYHCTIVSNTVTGLSGVAGAASSALYNCIAYHNIGGDNFLGTALVLYSCTTPQPINGTGNITHPPDLRDPAGGDFRLRHTSPCLDTGTNLSAYLVNDFAGALRPLDGNGDGVAAYDMGAFEFVPLQILSATRAGSELTLTWDGAPGARLQKTPSLTTPIWTDVPGSEGLSAITVPVESDGGFFRLFNP